ncbi:MOB kinase activator 3B isoform X2 [Motacilla alba alba]|uniref:MOB kinase activator 3B isoform X2 n=1 Tax=Motacilla alba alba TaxID=1094192 RepID=UPI0018D568C0|nr:MOB kinase activator 3B isoform X2 [Motacilla alba alba]
MMLVGPTQLRMCCDFVGRGLTLVPGPGRVCRGWGRAVRAGVTRRTGPGHAEHGQGRYARQGPPSPAAGLRGARGPGTDGGGARGGGTGAEPSRAEPSRAEPSRAEPSRAEPSRAEPSRAEPSRAEPSRQYAGEPSQAVRVLFPQTRKAPEAAAAPRGVRELQKPGQCRAGAPGSLDLLPSAGARAWEGRAGPDRAGLGAELPPPLRTVLWRREASSGACWSCCNSVDQRGGRLSREPVIFRGKR